MRRSDGSRAEDDLVSFNREHISSAFYLRTNGLLPVEQYPTHHNIGLDGEVKAVATKIYIGQTGAHPYAIRIIHRDGAYAGGLRMVHIWVMREALLNQGGVEGLVEGQPLRLFESSHGHWAFRTVEIVPDVGVSLLFPEVGEHLDELPLIVAHGSPILEVLWDPTQEYLAVNGTGTADNLTPRDRQVVPVRCPGTHERPVVWAAHG